jgi:hypothetical protein
VLTAKEDVFSGAQHVFFMFLWPSDSLRSNLYVFDASICSQDVTRPSKNSEVETQSGQNSPNFDVSEVKKLQVFFKVQM